MPVLDEVKQKHRAVWAAGDYERIARGIVGVAEHVVRIAAPRPGERVLDLACGTGNTALAARARGAEVTGLDLTPELLAVARDRAAAAGWDDLAWVEGDAEDLPFPEGSFDVLLSSCGIMFAPDPARVAAELARVARPGARLVIQAWTAEGGVGRMFDVVRRHRPPAPGSPNPFAWGDPAWVQGLLGPAFGAFRFEAGDCPECADSPEAVADLFLEAYGPTRTARLALSPAGAEAFRADLVALFDGYRAAVDGKVRWGREYLLLEARRVG
ncbi:MAG TPA: methyltransferase domain-containing protein [Holophagaceae bacterium]|nr:methyltransferase domain-containing protein [Holophagaceae bacterium]